MGRVELWRLTQLSTIFLLYRSWMVRLSNYKIINNLTHVRQDYSNEAIKISMN